MKGKALAVQARRHQRQQNRTRAHEWHDLDAALVRAPHEQRARIGDGRATGFRDEPRVGACENRREQPVDSTGGRIHVEFANLDFLDRPLGADFLQERARGFRVFADVIAERSGACADGRGKHGVERVGIAVAERIGDQIEHAAHCVPQSG
ncbi:hypothetical protein PBS_64750 [Paraburkholderia sp. 2C]